jgi:hypothetical protein
VAACLCQSHNFEQEKLHASQENFTAFFGAIFVSKSFLYWKQKKTPRLVRIGGPKKCMLWHFSEHFSKSLHYAAIWVLYVFSAKDSMHILILDILKMSIF